MSRVLGKIIDVNEDGKITIEAYCDMDKLFKWQVEDVEVRLIDSRTRSDKQLRFTWALVGAIADWQGEDKRSVSIQRKMDFLINEIGVNAEMFSLANASMSFVALFLDYLIWFVLHYDIPTKFAIIEYVDDLEGYLYHCLMEKKCCICQLEAVLHHVDTVGMGANRDEIDHLGKECLPLCWKHHHEAHQKGNKDFMELYHIDKGFIITEEIAKKYKLGRKRK